MKQTTPIHIVYFDVNKTILMSDAIGNKSEQDVINGILAENVPELFHDWGGDGRKISYYDYITELGKSLYPRDYHERKDYRNELVHRFVEFLRANHPALLPTALKQQKLLHDSLEQRQHGKLVWSFSCFVLRLKEFWAKNPQLNSKLVFRTFGQDLDHLEHSLAPCFGDDADWESLHFTPDGGLLHRDGEYRRQEFGSILRNQVKARLVAVSDSYVYWRRHHFMLSAGKPLPIFEGRSFSPFFDDNIRGLKHHSLEHRDIIFPYKEKTGEGVLPYELLGNYLIRVNPYEAITDADYFIREYNEACKRAGYSEYII